MHSTETDYSELKNVNYELFLIAITIIYIINIPLNFLAPTPEMRRVIRLIDTGFLVIFIGDFLYRLISAKSKSNYLLRQYGWLDLLGSLPISGVRLASGVRSVRTIRLLQQYGGKKGSELRQDRAGSTLILVLFLGILVLEWAYSYPRRGSSRPRPTSSPPRMRCGGRSSPSPPSVYGTGSQ